ncbi:hypothetical protein [Coprobacter sp.]
MKLNILICTFNEGILSVPNILKKEREDIDYIVSFQCSDEKFLTYIPESLNRPDVRIAPLWGLGLCRNRNHALSLVDCGIALIADDDVDYTDDAFDLVLNTFKDNKSVDLAFFKIKTREGEPEYKTYPLEKTPYTRWKGYAPCSIEIAFRVDSVKKNNLWFDERFGLGSEQLSGGEEVMFVDACLKNGLKACFFPEYIVKHPYLSTGKNEPFSQRAAMTVGALCHHFKGWLAFPAMVKYTWMTYKRYKNIPVSPFTYYGWLAKGILYERSTAKNYRDFQN